MTIRATAVFFSALLLCLSPFVTASARHSIGAGDATAAKLGSPIEHEGEETAAGGVLARFRDAGLLRDEAFVENRGQIRGSDGNPHPEVLYTASAGDAQLFVTADGLSIVLVETVPQGRSSSEATGRPADDPLAALRSPVPALRRLTRVDFHFEGANPASRPEASGQIAGLRSFFTSGAPGGITGVRAFRALTWRDLWPGVDAEFHLADGGLKYSFLVRPGGSVSDIRIRYSGPAMPTRTAEGGLAAELEGGIITDAAPVSFAGDKAAEGVGTRVPTRFADRDGAFGFDVDAYDTSKPLLVDPFLNWSTYYGGSSSDYARDIRTDAADNIYVAGYTMSVDFPVTPGSYQPQSGGNLDIFLLKFNAERQREWATYYGGADEEQAPHVAIDRGGNVIVAGYTSSTDFPVTAGAYQAVNNGKYDAFVVKFDGSGARQWATYIGGGLSDECGGVAVDREGNIGIAGGTYSTNFPVSKNAVQTTNKGDFDVFLAKFSPAGARIFSSYLGGFGLDYANGVAMDGEGRMIIAGYTESANFPVNRDAAQTLYGGGSFDMFVLSLGQNGAPLWATYFGGSKEDRALAVATDGGNRILVSGYTESQNFPATSNAFQKKSGGGLDGVVVELNGKGAVVWASYVGGKSLDIVNEQCFDALGNVYVTGHTESSNFPVTPNAYQRRHGGAYDAFLVRLNSSGSRMFATYHGGKEQDIGYSLAAEKRGNILLTGITSSTDFPLTKSALQRKRAGFTDAFLVRILFDEPVANAGRDTAICLGASAQLGLPPVNGKPPYTYAWHPTAGLSAANILDPIASPRKTATYELTVTDADGATSTDSVTVTIRSLPRANAGKNVFVCRGQRIEIGTMASGGLSPYWYSWSPAEGLSGTDVPTPFASPAATTTYVVTVHDKNGCVDSDSVTVTVYPNIVAEAGENRTICASGETQIGQKATGGHAPYTYAWIPRDGLSNASAAQPTARPDSTTRYILTVTDAKGCRESDTVIVFVLPTLKLDAGPDQVICHGLSARIGGLCSNGKAPYTYAWLPADGLTSATIPQPLASPDRTTRYILTATDANGCTGVDTVVVTVNPTVLAHAGPDVNMCEGSSTPIGEPATGGTPPYSYIWSPAKGLDATNTPTPIAAPASTTRYIVSVTDGKGCMGHDTITVVVNPMPRIKADNDFSICKGSRRRLTVTVRGGRAPFRYEWEPRLGLSSYTIANPFANPDTTTAYTVTAIDANGCRVADTIVITVRPCSKADAGPDLELCTGSDVTLGGDAADPAEEPSYLWSPAIGLSDPKKLHPVAKPASTTQYVLFVTNMYGCETTDTMTVLVRPSPTAGAGPPVTVCEGGSVTIGTEASGGLPPYSYQWDPADGLSAANVARPVAQPSATTTYTLRVKDAQGCGATSEVRVTVLPVPVASAGAPATVCSGTVVPIGAKSSGGRGPFVYDWSPAEGLDKANIATPRARPEVTTTYRLTVTNAEGCQSMDSVTITVNPSPQPVISASGATTFCEGGAVTLDAGEGFRSYQWSDGRTERVIEVTKSGVYGVTVFDEHGCKGEATPVRVSVLPAPRPRLVARGRLRFCEGDEVVLDAGAGFATYRWSSGEDTRIITVRKSGSYAATVTNGVGCETATDSVDVTVYPLPRASIERHNDTLVAAPAEGYQWMLNARPLRGAVRQSLHVQRPGVYTVRTRGEGGCAATSEGSTVDMGSSMVAIRSTSAFVSDTVTLRLAIVSERGLEESGATEFEAVLHFKQKELLLLDSALETSGDEDDTRVTIRGTRTPGVDQLAELHFQAVATRSVRAVVVLEDVRWRNGLATAKAKSGVVRITKRK